MNKWKEIWNNEKRIEDYILELLINSNGFNSKNTEFTVLNWKEYTDELYKKIGISSKDSIFEVGCGSGAFLYPLFCKGHLISGLDYSQVLVNLANKIICNRFICEEAINLPVNEKFDIVLSHSIFFYFINLQYAENVIKKMILKSNKKIVILDINDNTKKEAYHNLRASLIGMEEYKKKYYGLEHLFYDKDWFKEIAEKYNLDIKIFDTSYKKYPMSEFKFNVIFEKKENYEK